MRPLPHSASRAQPLHTKTLMREIPQRHCAKHPVFKRRWPLSVAAALLISCANRTPDAAQVEQLERAQSLYREKRFEEARVALTPLAETHMLEAEVLLGRLQFFTRQFAESESTLRSAASHSDESPYAMLWLGRVIASDEKRLAEAAEIFRGMLRRDPENHAAHYYLGRCLEGQGHVQQALLEFERARAAEYQLSKLHLHMGELFGRLSMPDRANRHFKRVRDLGVYPDDVEKASESRGRKLP